MNKITSTLAGIAIVATASIVPALAQSGSFTTPGPFTFAFTGTTPNSYAVTLLPVTFNPSTGASETGNLTLTGGLNSVATPDAYTGTTLLFTGTGAAAGTTVNDTLTTTVVSLGGGIYQFGGGPSANGNSVDLRNGSPVPEASTVISFGALLALGGLAVLRRKSVKA